MDTQAATRYPDLETLTDVLAQRVTAELREALAARGRAGLIVSGGKSPIKLFEALRTQTLDWSRVFVTLADERWVETDEATSNERLVRDVLLRDAAAAAHFAGLKNAAPTPELGAAAAWALLADWPRPFDLVLLGMGDDGHTASLFPGSPHLAMALDEAAAPGCIGMLATAAPVSRLSLNLSALLDSRRIVILITGAEKWLTYSRACGHGAVAEMPVRAVLRQRRTPVDVVWAP